jgi:cell division septation protein DedD
MDKLTKHRLTGAVIWLGALIWLVPQWYANPVDYPQFIFSGSKSAVDDLGDIDFDRLVVSQDTSLVTSSAESSSASPASSANSTNKTQTPSRSTSTSSAPTAQLENPAVPAETQPGFYVRLISYQNPDNALRLEQRLQPAYPVSIGSFTTSSGRFYTVRVGPYDTREQAERIKAILDVELRVESIILDRTNQ